MQRGKAALTHAIHDGIDGALGCDFASMMHDRERRPVSASAISGKRRVMALPGRLLEPHAVGILASDNPEAIVLNLMQPQAARRRFVGFGGEARRDEPGREGTLTQHGQGT